LNGAATVWQPPVPARGTPLVRTDRIEWRKSDKMMLAGTFGRGVWTSSVLGKAQAVAEYPAVTYLDVPVNFTGENSVSADRFKWLFSDNNATDTTENTQHYFRAVGKYDVNLTINNDNALKTAGKIQVLPSLATPYKSGANVYAGNFDDATSDVHFGAWNTGGSKWERGVSSVPGKSGTHSGASAFLLEKTANSYKKNTVAYLQTPNFDMSKGGIYQFSFWANYDIQQGYDGLKVEYTLDKGLSWKQLGSTADADWYNYQNTSLVATAAFGRGESYITGLAEDWTRFKLNVSPFSGNANVAFRFVFKSDGDNVTGSGVAIDDVVLSRYDGKLETVVITQSGAYDKAGTSINVSFRSQPEYFAQTFTLQKSLNGRTWEDVEIVKAKGISSEELQDYPVEVKGTPLDLYYFRVKSVNTDVKSNYSFEFITPPFSVRRNKDVPLAINRVFPSPFTNTIGVTFTDIVGSEVVMNLYDDLGRLVATQTTTPNGVYQELKVPNLAKGVYFLSIKIGDGKPETTKLFGAGND
jgi:PKD repeat protein